ncbi:hypothetical protein [Pseudomonas fluorescens]|uniref:Uncharacterized protein n=1 Tax=Pseudomonas fluorescens TaxID=294 RepID=A0AAE2DLJ4_PSEFL|nr:hypothetical protein [Pseudomonas fluorescens]KIF63227.1 hypothetical protein QS95_04955 [Pseudomonas fluorescens]
MNTKTEFNDHTDFRFAFRNGWVFNSSADIVYLEPTDPALIFNHSAIPEEGDHYHVVLKMDKYVGAIVFEKEYEEFPAGKKIYLELSLKLNMPNSSAPISVAVNLSEDEVFKQEIRLKDDWKRFIFAFSSPREFDKGKVKLIFENALSNALTVNLDDITLYT